MIEKETRKQISNYWRRGKGEREWYNYTAESLWDHYKEDTSLFVGFLAVTSPSSTVKGNITLALRAYDQFIHGKRFKGFIPEVTHNLYRLTDGLEPYGPKVYPFWKALLGDSDAVVIDRWILRAYGFKSLTPKRKDFITRDIRRRAKHARVSAREYQAAVWFGIKYANGDTLDNRPYEEHIAERLEQLNFDWS